ncbi:MAG: hypothetical protein IJX14_07975 [Clostridia bacterium]|nr:hypothetical protein [Clostridia bacterium]
MELGLFLEGLKTSLVNRGIPPEAAAKHVAALGKTFTADDLTEIQSIRSPAEIEEIADSIAAIIYKNKAARSASQAPRETENRPVPAERPVHPQPVQKQDVQEMPQRGEEGRPEYRPVQSPGQPEAPVRYAQNSDDFFTSPAGQDKTPRGVAIFWTVLILTLPLTLGILAGILAVFGIVFLGLILLIIGLVLGMIALVAAGAGVALVGIIYGITQLFSFMAAGLYEIGLGVMIGGGVLLAGVILYNLAIRFLPWVMKWLTVFFVFVFGRIRNLFYLARRECYKL